MTTENFAAIDWLGKPVDCADLFHLMGLLSDRDEAVRELARQRHKQIEKESGHG